MLQTYPFSQLAVSNVTFIMRQSQYTVVKIFMSLELLFVIRFKANVNINEDQL